MIRAEAAWLATVVIALRANDAVRAEKNVEPRMRDAVILRADVYRPAADGSFPVLLQRTPYSKNDAEVRRAAQTIFHDATRPSRLVLPVSPR